MIDLFTEFRITSFSKDTLRASAAAEVESIARAKDHEYRAALGVLREQRAAHEVKRPRTRTYEHEEEEGEGAEAVRALAGTTPACVSPDPNASPPFAPRANKTRARTGEGVDEAESAALATSATRLDMDASAEEDANDFAEDAETAEDDEEFADMSSLIGGGAM